MPFPEATCSAATMKRRSPGFTTNGVPVAIGSDVEIEVADPVRKPLCAPNATSCAYHGPVRPVVPDQNFQCAGAVGGVAKPVDAAVAHARDHAGQRHGWQARERDRRELQHIWRNDDDGCHGYSEIAPIRVTVAPPDWVSILTIDRFIAGLEVYPATLI